ncbi:MAG: YdcF family protein [Alphaproteobacteria bacterium]|nr:YdcF family protein [Alphaproteobacteria bacterium]
MMIVAVVRRLIRFLTWFNRRLLMRVVGGCLLLWLMGFGWWLFSLPPVMTDAVAVGGQDGAAPMMPRNLVPADAIVVLTGGVGRINSGLSLLADGLAPRLFISGVHKKVDTQQMAKAKGAGEGKRRWLDCCVTLGYHARDTIENAAEVADWVQKQDPPVAHLYLVTHRLHMPRALYLLRQSLPDQIVITPYPIADPYGRADWRFWSFAISEYSKGLAVRMLY